MKLVSLKIFLASCACFLALTGCAILAPQPAKAFTFANRDSTYSETLERIILVCPAKPASNQANVWPAIAEKLKAKGVVVEIISPNPLELNKGHAVREAIRRLGATHTITTTLVEERIGTRGGFLDAAATYETTIQAMPLGAVLWRSKTVVGYTRIESGEREGVVASSLVDKIVASGLIKSTL